MTNLAFLNELMMNWVEAALTTIDPHPQLRQVMQATFKNGVISTIEFGEVELLIIINFLALGGFFPPSLTDHIPNGSFYRHHHHHHHRAL